MPGPIKRSAQEDARFRILRLLGDNPNLTQRQLAEALGVSLGAVNFCLKAMIDVGLVKAKNFRSSENKRRYAYIITAEGIAEKVALTCTFVQRKVREYEALKAEIDALQSDADIRSASTEAQRSVEATAKKELTGNFS